jgi:uncharacterized protein (TIGR00251 family)
MGNDPQPSARLKVKVVPGSSRDQIAGWLGDALKINVTAPPERGKANEAVIELVAERLGLPASDVEIVTGHGAPMKELSIRGIDSDALKNAFL